LQVARPCYLHGSTFPRSIAVPAGSNTILASGDESNSTMEIHDFNKFLELLNFPFRFYKATPH
jgi:hypothetical protein